MVGARIDMQVAHRVAAERAARDHPFDGLFDNATAAVGGAASAVKDARAGLVEKGGEVTGTLGEKATGAASGVGAVILDNFDAAVTFAKGLFGG